MDNSHNGGRGMQLGPIKMVLELVLFNLFIKYLELGLKRVVVRFADDMKLFRKVTTKANCKELQEYLHRWGE